MLIAARSGMTGRECRYSLLVNNAFSLKKIAWNEEKLIELPGHNEKKILIEETIENT